MLRAMSHQVAKLILEQAGTFLERTEAVRSALQLGMPLNEIEEYLDWLDSVRQGCGKKKADGRKRGDIESGDVEPADEA